MVLFVGTLHESYFAKKIVEKREEEFALLDDIRELQYLINDILRSKANTVILDISPYVDEVETVVSAADKIQDGLNCKIIILAKGFLPGSQIIQAFYHAGYTDFILGTVLSFVQKELEDCLDGVFAKTGAPEDVIKAAESFQKENPLSKKEEAAALKAIKEAQKRKISIGVAGAKHFIGTTTQAVQIAKYFIQAGRSAAIVEMNSSGFFDTWASMEDERDYQLDKGISLLKFKGLDIYLEPSQITKHIRQKYGCMVYDYGCYFDTDFEKLSFLEKDVGCLVGGSKVNEYAATNKALLETKDRENMYYLFSFTSHEDAKDIRASMKELSEHTLFPAYTPDMFVYSPDNNYEKFFKYKLQVEKQKEKKRFSFFRKKGGEA